jgi:ribonuclease P protein component
MQYTEPLRNNFEFKRMYYKGKSAVTPNVAVYCMKNRGNINRLGLTVGSKLGNAVARNKIRRRMREVYRLLENNITAGYDVVIVARGRSTASEYRYISRDIAYCLKKLGLLKNESKV